MHELVENLKLLPLLLASVLCLCASIGIFNTKNALEKMHFATLIDCISLPLISTTAVFILGLTILKFTYITIIAIVLSPISTYFISKIYYKDKSSSHIEQTNDEILNHD